ncbi:cytochrome c-type biogenesis protein [Marinobacter bohaiensis]|uniref:cytochrome c-type biogenesis protein n=1 Tax=Marinobacter bohaiensis TaxID=2201898 RepID=UPI000DAF113A|nr:cytochrome c-type biogenesis protein [Marinobacter bohaiensis]
MRALLLLSLIGCLVGFSAAVQAADDTYPLDSAQDRQRFETLTRELRCPKCQNQSIADSNAPIASDMRAEVHRLVQAGESNEAIMEAMTGRFGEFVRYRPEFEPRTVLLWLTPLIVVLIGLLAVFLVVRRSRSAGPGRDSPISEQERARLDAWLDEDSDTDSPRQPR